MTDKTTQDKREPTTISGRDARQGSIILKRPWQRFVFIAGLVGLAVLALLWSLLG